MNAEGRYEQYNFSWGSYFGFVHFFARKLFIPGILHLILIAAGVALMLSVGKASEVNAKWILGIFAIVEIGLLTWFGLTANRASWKSCTWKNPHKFTSSNGIWGFFGRLVLLMRVLNVIGYCLLCSPSSALTTPTWMVVLGFILIPIAIALIVWRVRGPIWAVALNTLKESVGKLEVITLFVIGVVFVIFFNAIWLVPSVQDTVIEAFMAAQDDVGTFEQPFNQGEEVDQLEVSTRPQTRAFADEDIQKETLRLQVQVAAFLFGEFFIALICFAVGIFLVTGEINRGVVLTILPKPIGRGEYIIGKILGGWLIIVICFEAMALVAMLFSLPYTDAALNNIPNILHAMLLMPIKYAILISLITYLSLWLPEAAAGFIGLALFITGHASEKILDMAFDEFSAMPMLSQATKAAYVMMPDLSWVLSTSILDPNGTEFIGIGPIFKWIFSAGIYFAVVTAAAVLSFRKRSL